MNRAKSMFVGLYPMLAMATAGYSGWRLVGSGDWVLWLGPLATVVPFLVFLSWVMLFRNVARTSANFVGLNLVAGTGLAVSAYAVHMRTPAGDALAFTLAGVGATSFALYSVWYSRLGRGASTKLAVGRALPTLELRTAAGDAFSTDTLLGDPAILFFYRGNWCPLCMAQIKEVAARYREITALGARALFISPQPESNTAVLAKRFDLDLEFLVDEGGRAGRSLEIEMRDGLPMGMGMLGYAKDTVFPTVVIVDAKGVVRWLDQTNNYRVRPEPDTFLPLLRQIAGAAA